MQTVTTKAIAKVAAVATGLAMATSMLSLAPIAHAASLTASQVSSILSLLSSFGASSATIANVNAALTGGTSTTSGSTTTTTSSCSFSADLTIGSKGAAVTCLQQALIAAGHSIPAGATGYFGAQTQAAVSAWQKSAGVTPTAGYFGAKSRAAWNLGGGSSSSSTTTTTTTTTQTAGTGNGLKVSLAATSPNGAVLVQGQGIGDIAEFTFANPTASPINVTNLKFMRIGVSNDSTLNNVYLFNGGTRITDSAGVSSGAFSFSDPTAIFTVPAGGVYTVAVRADIADTTSGQQIGAQLVSVTSNGTLDSSVSLPINSGYQTISAANLATVNFNVNPTPSAAITVSAQNDYPVWQDTVTVSTNPVKLTSMKFTNLGSADNSNLINLRLYVDGTQVGNAVPNMASDRSVTFDLSAAPFTMTTQSHVVKVLANIIGGASLTVQFSVQRSSDGMFVDSQLGQPVTPTYNSTTFSAATTAAITLQSASAGVSVAKDPASPSSNVAAGSTNVKWASFDMLASGENVKVTDLYVYASSTTSGGALAGVGGLNNGKVYFNGVQVGSTKDLGSLVAAKQDFSLGSSLILPAGQTVTVDIYADAQDTAGTNLPNNATVIVSLAANTSNAQGVTSLTSTGVPNGTAGTNDVSGNTITVSNSSLTATAYTGYGAQTVIQGSNNVKIGAFTLSTGSTEGVSVNTIALTLSGTSNASITNMMLKDDATGNVLGTTITSPASGTNANTYSVNLTIPASSTKTIDVYANVLASANAGSFTVSVDTSTTGTGSVTGIAASVTAAQLLQTITVGTGSLSITRGAGDPVSNNVVAGASSVLVGEFNFAGASSPYTVQNVAILIPNGEATSVTNVTLSYKDVNGATQTATQAVSVGSLSTNPYATATFTGLTMYVPANDSSNLDVSVGVPTVASGAVSGTGINVSIDGGGTSGTNGDFKAINGAGVALTNVNSTGTGTSGPKLPSNGTFYVRKSVPTFAMLAAPSATPSSGSALYRFSITADPAGAIEWSHLKFNIATSATTAAGPMLSNMYLTDEASGVSLTDSGVYATSTISTMTFNLLTNTTAPQYQQVAAGATKTYDLYGTVNNWTTGSSITISLASDSAATSTTAAATVVNNLSNVVWSDRSASGHSVSTSDWTGGYLLKNFTTNATSYSK